MTPFIPGVNYMPDIDDDLKGLTPEQAIENANSQSKQRAIERSIRQSKELLHVAEKLGDQELIDKYKSKVRIQQGAMRDYLKQHPFLHRDYAREKYYDDPFSQAQKEIKLRKKMSEYHYIKEDKIPGFKKVGGKITKAERKVIYADEKPQGLGYIGTPHSFAINKYLRDKNVMPSEYQNIVDTLDGVIKKNRALKISKSIDLTMRSTLILSLERTLVFWENMIVLSLLLILDKLLSIMMAIHLLVIFLNTISFRTDLLKPLSTFLKMLKFISPITI